MYTTIEDLTGRASGTIRIGIVKRLKPRAYEASCTRCNSTFTLEHSFIQTRLQAQLTLQCGNSACRMNVLGAAEYGRLAHQAIKKQERELAERAEYERLHAIYGGTNA